MNIFLKKNMQIHIKTILCFTCNAIIYQIRLFYDIVVLFAYGLSAVKLIIIIIIVEMIYKQSVKET